MIVLFDERSGLSSRRVHASDRLFVRLRASTLDRELAAGYTPDRDFALLLHAERITRRSERCRLARSLERIVAAADRPTPARLKAPLARDRVRGTQNELEALIGRLLSRGPVGARGVGLVRKLVTDGTGPLYTTWTERDLRAELKAALAAMDPIS